MNLPREYLVEVGKNERVTITPDYLWKIALTDDTENHRDGLRRAALVIESLEANLKRVREFYVKELAQR